MYILCFLCVRYEMKHDTILEESTLRDCKILSFDQLIRCLLAMIPTHSSCYSFLLTRYELPPDIKLTVFTTVRKIPNPFHPGVNPTRVF